MYQKEERQNKESTTTENRQNENRRRMLKIIFFHTHRCGARFLSSKFDIHLTYKKKSYRYLMFRFFSLFLENIYLLPFPFFLGLNFFLQKDVKREFLFFNIFGVSRRGHCWAGPQNLLDGSAVEFLFLEQQLSQGNELVVVLHEHLLGVLEGAVDHGPRLRLRLRVQVLREGHPAATLRLLRVVLEAQVPHALRHTVQKQLVQGNLGRALKVVHGTGADVAERQLLRDAAAGEHAQLREKEHIGVGVEGLFLHLLGVATGATTGDDGELDDVLLQRARPRHDAVADLVIGRALERKVGHALAVLLSDEYVVDGVLEVLEADVLLAGDGGGERGLVDDGGDLSGGHAGGAVGQGHCELDVVDAWDIDHLRGNGGDLRRRRVVAVGALRGALGRRCVGLGLAVLVARDDAGEVEIKQLAASGAVGHGDGDFAVEASLTEQGLVDGVREVRRGHDDDVVRALHAVELRQQLVDGAVLLRRGPAHAPTTAAAADGVNFVDKHHTRVRRARGLEELAHTLGTAAAEHLNEVSTAAAEEGHIGLTGDGLCEQRLARAGTTRQEAALGETAAELRVLAGVLKEVNVLPHLLLGLVDADDVLEVCPLNVHAEVAALERVEHFHQLRGRARRFRVHHAAADVPHRYDKENKVGNQRPGPRRRRAHL
eukprot:PhM_4_TR6197/c0_g1_i1/m.43370